uniref:Uncharacterized protein n=1 Tax=Arion vulgaris TaxID=1028688 RepID=A0A0B6ZQT8_9EUPU
MVIRRLKLKKNTITTHQYPTTSHYSEDTTVSRSKDVNTKMVCRNIEGGRSYLIRGAFKGTCQKSLHSPALKDIPGAEEKQRMKIRNIIINKSVCLSDDRVIVNIFCLLLLSRGH